MGISIKLSYTCGEMVAACLIHIDLYTDYNYKVSDSRS